MDKDLAQEAILHALRGNWEEAVKINTKILDDQPNDVDALNRLAKAYAEVGKFKKAISSSQKVLKLDSFNTIATKALTKWKGLKKGEHLGSGPSAADTFSQSIYKHRKRQVYWKNP